MPSKEEDVGFVDRVQLVAMKLVLLDDRLTELLRLQVVGSRADPAIRIDQYFFPVNPDPKLLSLARARRLIHK